jgi:hypothetical protein
MKKLWIAFAIAMAALMIIASPAFAWGGSCGGSNANVDVDCSEIDVTDDSPCVGTTITFSGTVDITAEAHAKGFLSVASASSHAYYEIRDPEGNIVAQGVNDISDCDIGLFSANAYANQPFVWFSDVYIDMAGDYIAEHGGWAEVSYLTLLPFRTGCECDSCSIPRTVTAHPCAVLSTSRVRPILTIQLPAGGQIYLDDHSKQFFTSDGWGDPTTDVIVYNDGIWQVEIAVDTTVQLDGTWHDKTWIEVDDQGNVIGRYGSDGHIIAEEIGLSNPITVTKVG